MDTSINKDEIKIYHKTTWDILKLYHRMEVANVRFLRTPEIDEQYKQHLENLKKIKRSVIEEIYSTIGEQITDYSLQPNNFGYNIDDDVKHMCIWWKSYNKDFNILSNEGNNYIKSILDSEGLKYLNDNQNNITKDWNELDNYIYFENAPSNKSIPEIKHIHIFIKI